MKQKLSKQAAAAKKKRDLAYALTARRRRMKARTKGNAVQLLRTGLTLPTLITTIQRKDLFLLKQTVEVTAKELKRTTQSKWLG